MRSIVFTLALPFCVVLSAQTGTNPESAQLLVTNTVKKASTEQKSAFVAFHASWCSWCKRLENFLDLPEVKPIIGRYFSVLWLTVNERGENKSLENPGASDFLKEWTNGVSSGIPFFVLLDSNEKVVASSIRAINPGDKPGNIGFPGNEVERKSFVDFLKVGAPNMSATEESVIIKGLESIMAK
ncbi:MAG: thioredoxin family protein [Holophagaceae bacterium]|nr:thioredoxin family protein [Holophagaceae bacterium]